MSEYIKHEWKKGEEITSAALNNIETGITEAKREASQVTATAQTAQKDAEAAREAVKAITPEGIGAAKADHTHTLTGLDGTLTVAKGGTGATTAAKARENLGAAAKSTAASLTVAASAWTGDAAPYTAIVSTALATASNNLIVGTGGALTVEQQEALAEAMIICTGQAAGSITLSAFGDKPEIDLPVNILCVG